MWWRTARGCADGYVPTCPFWGLLLKLSQRYGVVVFRGLGLEPPGSRPPYSERPVFAPGNMSGPPRSTASRTTGRTATVAVMDPLEGRGGAKTPEQEVAEILPIEVDPARARRVLAEVPFWFHTFALNRAEGIYTPGVAVDHRYRLPFVPASFARLRVLDVGTFDGFYAFVAEARGAQRVVAIDSEQYVAWVRGALGPRARGRRGLPRDRRPARLARRVPPSRRRPARRARRDVRLRLLLRDPAPRRRSARPAAPPL